mgnify:CR=1 FL=1
MTIKEYFNSLPNRISANIFALLGFVNFLFLFCYIGSDVFHNSFYNFIFNFFIQVILFGIICLVSLPVLIPFLCMLKKDDKILSILHIFCIFILISMILYFLYKFLLPNTQILYVYEFYSHLMWLFSCFLIIIQIFYLIDKKKNFKILNSTLINNRLYRIFVKIFYCYFWILYIPFVIAFGIFIYISLF